MKQARIVVFILVSLGLSTLASCGGANKTSSSSSTDSMSSDQSSVQVSVQSSSQESSLSSTSESASSQISSSEQASSEVSSSEASSSEPASSEASSSEQVSSASSSSQPPLSSSSTSAESSAASSSFSVPQPSAKLSYDPEDIIRHRDLIQRFDNEAELNTLRLDQLMNVRVENGEFRAMQDGKSPVDPKITWTFAEKTIDLDLAFNDVLEFRLKLPENYQGAVQFFYTTSGSNGSGPLRSIRLPNSQLFKDGQFHTYRLDLGLEVWWRGYLASLRMDPLSGEAAKDASFALDYIALGDRADDDYLPRISENNPEGAKFGEPAKDGYWEMSSKRFRIIWNQESIDKGFDPVEMPRASLRTLEESWQVFTHKMHYPTPHESWFPAKRDGFKYQLNMTTWHNGYWAGGDGPTGFSRMNITGGGLRAEPPSWVIPHELAHAFQMHQTNQLWGGWWENHANYMREQWIYHFRELWADEKNTGSNLERNFLMTSHYFAPWGGHYYLCWPIFLYLDENPDGLEGLGWGTSAKLWAVGAERGGDLWDKLPQISDINRKDIVGYYARRNIKWNYSRQEDILNRVDGFLADPHVKRRTYITLEKLVDKPGWFQVPRTRAPQQFAYTVHELVPDDNVSEVTVEFKGLQVAGRQADWRASLVAVDKDDQVVYSEMFNGGETSLQIDETVNELFLVVAATPDDYAFGNHEELLYPYVSHPHRKRFPYQVRLRGAEPAVVPEYSQSNGEAHINGGGFVANTAQVDSSAFVGPNAKILNKAQIKGQARIEGYATIRENAIVQDKALISGYAEVRGKSVIKDKAKVRDFARTGVNGASVNEVSGSARILEFATVSNKAQVGEFCTVSGSANVWSATNEQQVHGGHAIVDGDGSLGLSVITGIHTGFKPFSPTPAAWINARTSPENYLAEYDFETDLSWAAKDRLGAYDARVEGAPNYSSDNDSRVLNFNGVDQYLMLDRALFDVEGLKVSVKVKAAHLDHSQPLLHLKNKNYWLKLVFNNAQGKVALSAGDGENMWSVESNVSVAMNQWTDIEMTLSTAGAGLSVDADFSLNADMQILPQMFVPSDALLSPGFYGVARNIEGPYFEGAIDNLYLHRFQPLMTAELN